MIKKVDNMIDLLHEKINTYLDKVKKQALEEVDEIFPNFHINSFKTTISNKTQECV